jgi:methylamine dehydrogenase light chain
MSGNDFEENKFDKATARVLDSFAQRVTRRSMLGRISKFTLTVMGVSVVPLLPLDRVVRSVEAQGSGCQIWQLCGIWGRRCHTCACSSGTNQSCPKCTWQGGSWSSCCPVRTSGGTLTGERRTVQYIDCCGQQGSTSCNGDASTCHAAETCHGNDMDPPQSQQNWCGGTGGNVYRCTHFIVHNPC